MNRILRKYSAGTYFIMTGMFLLFILFPFCKQVEQELKVKVETGTVGEVGYDFALINGTVVDIGNGKIDQHGFCYSTSENPTIFDKNTQLGSRTTTGSFSDSLLSLLSNTTYFVRAYAQATEEIIYGNQTSFTTLAPSSAVVVIDSVGEYKNDSVKVSSRVTDDGGSDVTARGVCWSLEENPSISGDHTIDGDGTGTYTSFIIGLDRDTTYYIRAYATSATATIYSAQLQVSTPPVTIEVTTAAISGITMTGAVSGGAITAGEGAGITARGVCWSASESPDLTGNHTTDGTGVGSFTSSINGLSAGTKYYVRAYVTSSSGTYYGGQLSFTTTSQSASLPVLTTSAVSSITENSAVSGGNITDDGGSAVSVRGVCWSTSHNPDLSDGSTSDGSGAGSFTSSITGLISNTTYYVRAYATNVEGTSYGPEVSFTTSQGLFLPTLTTTPVTSITDTSAVSGGNVTDDGGSAVTARGICWSTSENPGLSDNFSEDGTGLGVFMSAISDLTSNTVYYVRAYATNDVGTAFGGEVSFTSGQTASLPVLSTSAVTGITETSAESGGDITDNGGSLIIARGVCWGTSHNPDLGDSYTTDGTGTGSYNSSMTGLSSNTTYYVRAYATNNSGTTYGNEVSLTTNTSLYLPTLTTASVTSVTENSAVSGGNITDDGGSGVIARGVCWSLSTGPDLTGNHTTDGMGAGGYNSSIAGLSPNTKYYVRAYATNGKGTTYGNEVSFTTSSSPSLPTLTTVTVNNIATNSAKSGGNVTDDGGSMVIARGVCWSTISNPDLDENHTSNGAGTGIFSSTMINLTPNTFYYVRAYATNTSGTAYGDEVTFTSADMGETVTDFDGNVYQTVVIGSQTWMAENLATTHYVNGDPIPQITDLLDWNANDGHAFCYYSNDYVTYGETYGALYNWWSVDDSRQLCPSGWHVPSAIEWDTLIDFVGGIDVAGAKLKEVGSEHWNYGYATNEYGFTALPGGERTSSGDFYSITQYGLWWSSTQPYYNNAYYYSMKVNYYSVTKSVDPIEYGHSVRCIKD